MGHIHYSNEQIDEANRLYYKHFTMESAQYMNKPLGEIASILCDIGDSHASDGFIRAIVTPELFKEAKQEAKKLKGDSILGETGLCQEKALEEIETLVVSQKELNQSITRHTLEQGAKQISNAGRGQGG